MRSTAPLLLCLSHLRWDFVYQRPQHVMSRFAKSWPVVFFEEPEFVLADEPSVRVQRKDNVTVVRPLLPESLRDADNAGILRAQLDALLAGVRDHRDLVLWYYTPMALAFSDHLEGTRVYDCMDELALFKDAPAELRDRERELFELADVVFTGGRSLYYAKRKQHANVHCFPSAVDADHFAPSGRWEPAVLSRIPRPRIGFYGVIDERFDCAFVQQLADAAPDWHVVLVGPVVKIDPATLPQAPNVHYVPMQSYEALPGLLEHWDAAFLPFALNDATRFISPTKTLEYLAAGKPVISTPIADVVDPYGKFGFVKIVNTGVEAAQAVRGLSAPADDRHGARLKTIDTYVRDASWDRTVAGMRARIDAVRERPAATVVADSMEAVG